MSDLTRRELLNRLAIAFAAAGTVDYVHAQHAHQVAAQSAAGGTYVPRALSAHEYRTLERLTDLIVPVDNGKPGAIEAGVPAWIDTLLDVNAELKSRYTAGLAWLDTTMKARGASDFAGATPAQQTALLDQIAFPKNATGESKPGVDFFTLARRMTVDGFYTSRIGARDLYPGNTPRAAFTVPQDAIDYVVSRSPFK